MELVAIISGPDFLMEITQALEKLNQKIIYEKIDRDIDIMSELEKIMKLSIKYVILDIACVYDSRKVPQAIRKLRAAKEDIRVIILAPRSYRGNEVIYNLISMGIYDIIGQREYEETTILPSLIEHFENPATYSKAAQWNNGIERIVGEEAKREKKPSTIEKDKIVGTVVIAVAGAMNRIGTTHTTLSLARFLIDNGHGVAVIEMHESSNFDSIKNSYENVEEKLNMFSLGGIDFYPYNPYSSISDFMMDDYAYIILDMGNYNKCSIEEFRRAHERILVSGVKDWEFEELEHILGTDEFYYKNKYYFTFSDKETFEFARSNMDELPCFMAPYNPQPLAENEECEKVFGKMLRGVLPQAQGEAENISLIDAIFKKNEVTLFRKPILAEKLITKAEAEQKNKRKKIISKESTKVVKAIIWIIVLALFFTSLYYLLSNNTAFTPLFNKIK